MPSICIGNWTRLMKKLKYVNELIECRHLPSGRICPCLRRSWLSIVGFWSAAYHRVILPCGCLNLCTITFKSFKASDNIIISLIEPINPLKILFWLNYQDFFLMFFNFFKINYYLFLFNWLFVISLIICLILIKLSRLFYIIYIIYLILI